MSMAAERAEQRSYRERTVDKTLDDHEKRITANERRWLITKGALGMLALTKGADLAISQLIKLL